MMTDLTIRRAEQQADFDAARLLFREYADSLGVDLCFQNFERELQELPAMYGPPHGVLLLAGNAEPVGCVAVRQRRATGDGELKRLYVRPAARGTGLGRALTLAAIEHARRLGYARLCLDTLPSMHAARKLYAELGFEEIAPYYDNPVEGVKFLQLRL